MRPGCAGLVLFAGLCPLQLKHRCATRVPDLLREQVVAVMHIPLPLKEFLRILTGSKLR